MQLANCNITVLQTGSISPTNMSQGAQYLVLLLAMFCTS